MAPKRKRSNSDDYDDEAGPSGAGCSTCNFCLRAKPLLPGKRYCSTCTCDRIECHSCHQPLDEHFMEDNGRCRACNAKRQKQSSAMGAANIIDVSPQDVGKSDPLLFAQASREPTRIQMENSFLQFKGVKWYLFMIVKMVKFNREGEIIMDVIFHSELETMLFLSDFDLQFDRMIDAILPFQRELDITNLKFPLAVSDVVKFEKLNAAISVNVFAFEDRSSCIYPIYVTSFKGRQHHVNLLLIVDNKIGKSHYILIRNMSRLLGD